jgi:hypothetical protein
VQSLVAAQLTQARPALKQTALVCKADGMGCKPRSQAAAQAMGGALTLRFQTRPEACSAAARAWRMLHSGLRLRSLSASRSASTAPPINGDRCVPHDAHALWRWAKGQIKARGAHIPESAETVAGTAGAEAANAFCTPAAISLDRSNPPNVSARGRATCLFFKRRVWTLVGNARGRAVVAASGKYRQGCGRMGCASQPALYASLIPAQPSQWPFCSGHWMQRPSEALRGAAGTSRAPWPAAPGPGRSPPSPRRAAVREHCHKRESRR